MDQVWPHREKSEGGSVKEQRDGEGQRRGKKRGWGHKKTKRDETQTEGGSEVCFVTRPV